VSFEVGRGEALGIIGPNGAGKTTILRLLSRITEPMSGRIVVNGRVSALIELGAGFHPELTGRENIFLNAAILGLTRQETERRFDSIVAFSGLECFIDTPVKRYSSGMYVRLGFSVAAHVEPDVLLVDEVLAVGDAQFRLRCAERIKDLRQLNTTIVFISHNLPLVASICDRAICLDRGQIVAQGEVVDVINHYEDRLQQIHTANSPTSTRDSLEPDVTPAARITGIAVCSSDVDGSGDLWHEDRVEVRVRFHALETVVKPNLVIRLTRADGVVGGMIRTIDYGIHIPDLLGRGVISVALDPLQLAYGTYVVDVRLLGSLDGVPLAQAHSNWFRVRSSSPGHGESAGVFVPRVASVQIVSFADRETVVVAREAGLSMHGECDL
jgi:lipopolysaccharide transport system ATP-binding protein